MNSEPEASALTVTSQVERLHRLIVGARWLVNGGLWLTVGAFSLWTLRFEFELWRQYFTWVAVRYALAHNFLAALGLGLCIGTTTATLVWQSRNILWGRPRKYQQRLEQTVFKIRQQGKSHPLWRWVCQD